MKKKRTFLVKHAAVWIIQLKEYGELLLGHSFQEDSQMTPTPKLGTTKAIFALYDTWSLATDQEWRFELNDVIVPILKNSIKKHKYLIFYVVTPVIWVGAFDDYTCLTGTLRICKIPQALENSGAQNQKFQHLWFQSFDTWSPFLYFLISTDWYGLIKRRTRANFLEQCPIIGGTY